MKSKLLSLVCALLLVPAVKAVALPALGDLPAVSTEPEQFHVDASTEVPNVTLAPGSYTIRIVDHLRDRVILQVTGKNSHVATTFLAVPASTMANAPVGPISYSTGPKGKAAMKGFSFPGGTAVEFVYPKNDAVSIATANGTGVMAIDPASEGRVAAPKLNQSDMQMITLWMLEPSRVGPGSKPSISATRYKAPAVSAPAPAVETAENQPAPAPAPARATYAASRPAPRATRPAPQVASNEVPPPPPARVHTRPANVKVLPHTASSLPVLELGTLVAFGFAGLLTTWRLRGVRS